MTRPAPPRDPGTPGDPRARAGPRPALRRLLARGGPAGERARRAAQPGRRPAGRRGPAGARPGARHRPGAAGRRRRRPHLQRAPPLPLHAGLRRAVRPAGRHRGRPGRRVDRGPVPGGRRRHLHRRAGARPEPPGVRAGWSRLAARRAPGTAVAGSLRAGGDRPRGQRRRPPDGHLVAARAGGLRAALRLRRRRLRRVGRGAGARPAGGHARGARVPHRGGRRRRPRGGVPRAEPAPRRAHRRPGPARRPPLRVAGPGAAGRRGLPHVPRRPGHGGLRGARLPRAHHRADLRGVRPPGLRPAHRGHRAHPAGRVGRRPQGAPRDGRGPRLAALLAGTALRADAGRGRLGALPHARLPGGVRLHPAAPAGRRLRGLAGAAGARRARVRPAAARDLAAPGRAAQRRRAAAGARGDQPGRLDRAAQPRPVRRHRQGRLDLPARALRRRGPGARHAARGHPAVRPGGPGPRLATTGWSGTSGGTARRTC